MPAAYLAGANNAITPTSIYEGGVDYGTSGAQPGLNPADFCAAWASGSFNTNPPTYTYVSAPLPRADGSANYWGNQMLTNNQAIDFQGNPDGEYDPETNQAAQYHPYAYNTNWPGYAGTGPSQTQLSPTLNLVPVQYGGVTNDWAPGEMRCTGSRYPGQAYVMQTNAASPLTFTGGVQTHTEFVSTLMSDWDPVPLETVDSATIQVGPDGVNPWFGPATPTDTTDTLRSRFLQMVVPVNFSQTIPPASDGSSPAGPTVWWQATVADPLVNKFPGDWNVTVTTNAPAVTPPSYWENATNGYTTVSGNEFTTGFHGKLTDPYSYWLPQADAGLCFSSQLSTQTLIPRSARFPNIGYLQYVRTGIIPDNDAIATASQWQSEKGTPFRLLSFAPSSDTANQKTSLSTSQPYPDWAMLDLLYVPSFLASYGGPYGYYDPPTSSTWTGYGDPNVLAANSTYGGSTPGRINPNGIFIYTTNANIPRPDLTRTVPMQAVLQNLVVQQSLTSASTMSTAVYSGGTTIDAPTIAQAIVTYMSTNGPLRMPAELCNVPEIAALRPSVNPTRNDLIRQIVGALTTQSNTFSVWVAGQSIQKSKGNTSYGIYQTGDQIMATVRYHYIVERYLDPGADGVYGNSSQAASDATNGTHDDSMDPSNHPFCPRYFYRVVSAEEVR